MDDNNWRPSQGGTEPAMDPGDWRTQLQNESRQRIVNKIMDTLKRHLPFSGQEGLQELRKIAIRFEEKIYTAATSQSDYLRKISLKMLTMESKTQNTMANSLPSNSASNSKTSTDAGSLGMQTQNGNQGPPVPVPMGANQGQARQQLLAQAIQNNMVATVLQGSSSLTSTMPGGSGLPQSSVPNVGQNTNSQNMQGISGVSQNSVANSMGQGVSANMYANIQRPMQGRQQVLTQQQQQQPQPQTPQQILYQQQLQQQYRQKYAQGNNQNSHMQSQQNLLQSSQQSGQSNIQQSQQSSVQPSSMLQQNSQPVLRQHSQMQTQSMLSQQQQQQQQQQQLLGQQTNSTSLHPNQLLAQQNNMSDIQQQQRLLGQHNNLSNLQQQSQQQLLGQQQLGSQGNVPGLHQQQQQQQQMLGVQSGNSSMQNNQHPVHMLQHTQVTMPQQNQQNSTMLLPSQGQQSQSQIQSQPGQPQQQLGMQQQQNQLHRDMQQRLQSSGPLIQPQNMIDQQKQQLFQSQKTIPDAPSSSSDSTAQTGNANGGDWQEEVYQKIKTMKEAYLPELNEMYLKIASKMLQHDTPSQQPQVDKLKAFKTLLERIMTFLQVPKSNILPTFREKLGGYEKQIINFLNSNRPRKPGPSMQQLPPSQMQPHENPTSSQLQSLNVQGSVNPLQNNITSLPHNSLSPLSGAPNANQNMVNTLQSKSNIESSQGNTRNTMQQIAVGMQQSVGAPQQVNMNLLSSQNGMSSLQPNLSPLQQNSNMLQQQQLKQQEQQMLHNHQMKQKIQQHHMQQQLIHKQQLLQQQQQQQQHQMLQQTKLQPNAQLQAHQTPQLHQMNDMDMKMRQQIGVKGSFQQNQRSMYHHQQLKSGSPFSISSPQLLQSSSPQIPQHSSPQMDQQNLLPSLTKTGTPLQSANSPFIVPSPSTPLAPSPMPGESEKATSGVSALPNIGGVGHQQAATAVQSLAIGTPGISASPLLAEFTSPDGNQGNMSTAVSGKSSVTEQPLDRLLKAVKSMSSNGLRASVNDIGSVVSMIDRIAGSAPGNGSRAAVGEDLVAMAKCRLQARNFITQDGNGGTRKMRRLTSAMPLNVVSSTGSVNEYLTGTDTADLDSTATSPMKRPRVEANHALLEEIREINQRLIDTVVGVSDEDVDATVAASAASEGGEGTVVKCSYCAVALSPNLKSQYASAQMSPIQPLRLLVPTNYPNSSPILLDKFPIEASKEYEDLSSKAKSRFSISLRNLSQPMSLGEIARTWDVCARAVISEYAQQSGGGSFSSKYGSWEDCFSAA